MAVSRYWVEDILTGIVLTQDLPLNDVQVEDGLNRPGALRGTLPVDHPMATTDILDEGRRAIYWERDGKIEFGGILHDIPRPLGERKLNIQAEGWLGYLDRRDIWTDRQFTNTDQFNIVKTLVDDMQDEAVHGTGMDLGIEVVWDSLSGVLRDRLSDYRDYKAANLGQAIRQLASVQNGFDYGMQYTVNLATNRIEKRLKLWYPHRGRDTKFVFEFDGSTARREIDTYPETYPDTYAGSLSTPASTTNITAWGVNATSRNMAWRARGWGDGSEEDRLMSQQINEARRGVYPPYDASFTGFTGVSEQTTLDENTAGALSHVDHPIKLPLVKINPEKYPKWGDWELGDTVHLRINDGYGSIGTVSPAPARIIGWQVSPKENRPVLAFQET